VHSNKIKPGKEFWTHTSWVPYEGCYSCICFSKEWEDHLRFSLQLKKTLLLLHLVLRMTIYC